MSPPPTAACLASPALCWSFRWMENENPSCYRLRHACRRPESHDLERLRRRRANDLERCAVCHLRLQLHAWPARRCAGLFGGWKMRILLVVVFGSLAAAQNHTTWSDYAGG